VFSQPNAVIGHLHVHVGRQQGNDHISSGNQFLALFYFRSIKPNCTAVWVVFHFFCGGFEVGISDYYGPIMFFRIVQHVLNAGIGRTASP
jgi:hypothetical protein